MRLQIGATRPWPLRLEWKPSTPRLLFPLPGPKQHMYYSSALAWAPLPSQVAKERFLKKVHHLRPSRLHAYPTSHTIRRCHETKQQNIKPPTPVSEAPKGRKPDSKYATFIAALFALQTLIFIICYCHPHDPSIATTPRTEEDIRAIFEQLASFEALLADKTTPPSLKAHHLNLRASYIRRLGRYEQSMVREVMEEVGYRGIKESMRGGWEDAMGDLVKEVEADISARTTHFLTPW